MPYRNFHQTGIMTMICCKESIPIWPTILPTIQIRSDTIPYIRVHFSSFSCKQWHGQCLRSVYEVGEMGDRSTEWFGLPAPLDKITSRDDVIKWKNFPQTLDVFFDLHLNERLSKHSWGWWLEAPSCPLGHYSNVNAGRAARSCRPFRMTSSETQR